MTWVGLAAFMIPLKLMGPRLFDRYVPTDKFPVGSKLRKLKIDTMSDKIVHFVMYLIMSSMGYYILKSGNILEKVLGGDVDRAEYFLNYPCVK